MIGQHSRPGGLCLLLSLAAFLPGCAGMNHAQRGALVGTSIGGLAGGILGHQAGNTGGGAVLGAGLGMMAGTLAGDAEDAREERDWAIEQARYAEYQQAVNEPPLSNPDLIYMAQNGLSDEVLKNAIDARGGRFDLDPSGLVQLKQSGVSDSVIAHIQKQGGRRTSARMAPRNTTRVVYVEPAYPPPHVGWSVQFGPAGYSHRHCHNPHHW